MVSFGSIIRHCLAASESLKISVLFCFSGAAEFPPIARSPFGGGSCDHCFTGSGAEVESAARR
jgi:hypothetical protein